MATRVSFQFMLSMKPRDSASSTRMRKMEVICSDTKRFMVSISEVQRWMMSPVRCLACQA